MRLMGLPVRMGSPKRPTGVVVPGGSIDRHIWQSQTGHVWHLVLSQSRPVRVQRGVSSVSRACPARPAWRHRELEAFRVSAVSPREAIVVESIRVDAWDMRRCDSWAIEPDRRSQLDVKKRLGPG